MIALADQFTGQYRDTATMIESMLGQIAIVMREKGWQGAVLVDCQWHEKAKPGAFRMIDAPLALIVVAPGEGTVTVDHCRAKLKEHMLAEQRKTDSVDNAQQEGRLF